VEGNFGPAPEPTSFPSVRLDSNFAKNGGASAFAEDFQKEDFQKHERKTNRH
jgi:hypothetical protein